MSRESVALGWNAQFTTNKPASLSESLSAVGVPTLPQKRVAEHKESMMKSGRRPVRMLYKALMLLSFLEIVAMLQRRKGIVASEAFLTSYAVAAAVLVVSGICFVLVGHPTGALATVQGMATIATMLLTSSSRFQELAAGWERYSFDRTTGFVPGTGTFLMPAKLLDRAKKAESIRGVRTYVLCFEDDPLVFAKRGWGPWAEDVPIGAWDTGNAFLEGF